MDTANEKAPESEIDGAQEDEQGIVYENIKEEIHRLADDLGISLEEAARAVYSDHGMKPPVKSREVDSLGDLVPNMGKVTVKARIISVHKGERQGGEGHYFYGLLGDATSDIRFSAWVDFPYRPGTSIIAQNVSVREWNKKFEVVINRTSSVTITDDQEGLIPELEGEIPSSISELTDEMNNVDIQGRILEISRDTVVVKGSNRTILNGSIADATGRIDFTCWGPVDIQKDVCYRIIGGYVKSFRGSVKLNFDAGCIIQEVNDPNIPPIEDLLKPVKVRLADVSRGLHKGPVIITGTLVSVKPGSGLVSVCSQCFRRMMNGQCPVHGVVDPETDLRLRAILDDGTDTTILRGDRDLVERVIGKRMDALKQEAKEKMDQEFVKKELISILAGHPMKVTGDPLFDDYGMTLQAKEIEIGFDIDEVKDEIASMLGVIA